MTEKELSVFVDGAMNYFEQVAGTRPEVGVPYPKNQDASVLLDFTGAIGISGARKGCVYVTASSGLVDAVIHKMDSSIEPDLELRGDTAGEIANTIAGNAQDAFGYDFVISTPIVITGKPTDIRLPLQTPMYVIPFSWEGNKGALVVGIA
jgi:chemotaxis protein CheX